MCAVPLNRAGSVLKADELLCMVACGVHTPFDVCRRLPLSCIVGVHDMAGCQNSLACVHVLSTLEGLHRAQAALLMEKRVAIVAGRLNMASECVGAVHALLAPLGWAHAYVLRTVGAVLALSVAFSIRTSWIPFLRPRVAGIGRSFLRC